MIKSKIKIRDEGHYLTVRNGLRKYRFIKEYIMWGSGVKWKGMFGEERCSFINDELGGAEFKLILERLYVNKEDEKLAYCLLSYMKQYRRRHTTMIIRLIKAIKNKIWDAIKWLGK